MTLRMCGDVTCVVAQGTLARSDSHGAHRDVFRSKYLTVLDFVFGNKGAGAPAIAMPHMLLLELLLRCGVWDCRSGLVMLVPYAPAKQSHDFFVLAAAPSTR
jgi:hypothetical protein